MPDWSRLSLGVRRPGRSPCLSAPGARGAERGPHPGRHARRPTGARGVIRCPDRRREKEH